MLPMFVLHGFYLFWPKPSTHLIGRQTHWPTAEERQTERTLQNRIGTQNSKDFLRTALFKVGSTAALFGLSTDGLHFWQGPGRFQRGTLRFRSRHQLRPPASSLIFLSSGVCMYCLSVHLRTCLPLNYHPGWKFKPKTISHQKLWPDHYNSINYCQSYDTTDRCWCGEVTFSIRFKGKLHPDQEMLGSKFRTIKVCRIMFLLQKDTWRTIVLPLIWSNHRTRWVCQSRATGTWVERPVTRPSHLSPFPDKSCIVQLES